MPYTAPATITSAALACSNVAATATAIGPSTSELEPTMPTAQVSSSTEFGGVAQGLTRYGVAVYRRTPVNRLQRLRQTEETDGVQLVAPAVHQRVRRMKADGTVRAIQARLEGAAIGRTLLAFVHVDTDGWGARRELQALLMLPEIEELHTVAGDTCLLLKVRVADSAALEGLLARFYDVPGVRGTRRQVVLSTYLERSVQAGVTGDMARWADDKRYAE